MAIEIIRGIQDDPLAPISERVSLFVAVDGKGRLVGMSDLIGLLEENNRLLRKLIGGLEMQCGVDFPDVD